jgi:hypothetical protein
LLLDSRSISSSDGLDAIPTRFSSADMFHSSVLSVLYLFAPCFVIVLRESTWPRKYHGYTYVHPNSIYNWNFFIFRLDLIDVRFALLGEKNLSRNELIMKKSLPRNGLIML